MNFQEYIQPSIRIYYCKSRTITDSGWASESLEFHSLSRALSSISRYRQFLSLNKQFNSLKMKLLEPEFAISREKMNAANKQGNLSRSKELQKEMMAMRGQYGITFFPVFMNLFQIPFLVTWFLSLRYVLTVPELYSGILSR